MMTCSSSLSRRVCARTQPWSISGRPGAPINDGRPARTSREPRSAGSTVRVDSCESMLIGQVQPRTSSTVSRSGSLGGRSSAPRTEVPAGSEVRPTAHAAISLGESRRSGSPAECGGQPDQVDVACFEEQPQWVGPAGGPAKCGQLPAAAAAELGAEWILRVLEQAVEQMLGPDPGVAALVGEAGGDLQRAFGEYVDAQGARPRVPTPPPWPAPHPTLGRLQRVGAEGRLKAPAHLIYLDAQGAQRCSGIGSRPECGNHSVQFAARGRQVQALSP